jgi:diguanylate cyclase (GGDEF)-like protein
MFDNQSVALIILPSLWASLIVLIVNWRIHRTMSGVGWWPLGLGLSTVGFVLRASSVALSPWLAVVLGSVLIIAGQLQMLRGLCAFAGRPMYARCEAAILGLVAGGMAWLIHDGAVEGVRLGFVTAALGATFLLQWRVLADIARHDGAVGVVVLVVTEMLVLALFGTRAGLMLSGHLPIQQLSLAETDIPGTIPATAGRLAVFVNSTVLAVLLAYGYILLATRRVQGELARLARIDTLTGVPNRLAFEEAMGQLQQETAHHRGNVALALLDIDRFKQINDTHGHEVGDAMLRHVAALIGAALPTGGIFARIGGEEFAIALACTGLADISAAAERIRRAVEQTPLPAGDQRLGVTISVGVAVTAPGEGGFQRLHRQADEALYRAKSQGRNRVVSAAA